MKNTDPRCAVDDAESRSAGQSPPQSLSHSRRPLREYAEVGGGVEEEVKTTLKISLFFAVVFAITVSCNAQNAQRKAEDMKAEDLFNLGVKHEKDKKNWKIAFDYFTKAIELNPNYAEAYKHRAETRNADGYGDLKGRIADLTAVLKINPQDADAYITRAIVAVGFADGEYVESLEDLNAALALDPKNAEALLWRAEVYGFLDRYDEREADEKAALLANCYNPRAYAQRAGMRLSLDDFDGAIADCTAALAMDSRFTQAFNWRSEAYLKKKHFAAAIADFSRLFELKPETMPYSYIQRGDAYLKIGEIEKAIADYESCIKLKREWADEAQKRLVEARKLLKKQ